MPDLAWLMACGHIFLAQRAHDITKL